MIKMSFYVSPEHSWPVRIMTPWREPHKEDTLMSRCVVILLPFKRWHCRHILPWVSLHRHNLHFLIVFKAFNGQAPSYISDLIFWHSAPTSLSIWQQISLVVYVPQSQLKLKGDRTFAVAAPWLWSQLPLDIRRAPQSVFKSRLKTVFKGLFGPLIF